MKILWKDIKSMRWAIIGIIAYLVLWKNILHRTCPVVVLTGIPCPGCGMTRAAFRLLQMDFVGAWKMHPFIYLVVFLAVWFCVERYVLGGEKRKWWMRCVVLTAILMIVFYIYRMVVYFPSDPPMNYESQNLLHILWQRF